MTLLSLTCFDVFVPVPSRQLRRLSIGFLNRRRFLCLFLVRVALTLPRIYSFLRIFSLLWTSTVKVLVLRDHCPRRLVRAVGDQSVHGGTGCAMVGCEVY